MLNRQQVRKTSKIYSQINRREDKQTRQNKHTHRLRNKMSKGSNDAIKRHNTFCAFEEADYMDFEEPPSRHHAFNSRSWSPALVSSQILSLTKGLVLILIYSPVFRE